MAEQSAGPQSQPPQPPPPQPPQLPLSAPVADAKGTMSPESTTGDTVHRKATGTPDAETQRPDGPKRADGPATDNTQKADPQRPEAAGGKASRQETPGQQHAPQRDATRELLDTLALSYGRVSQIDRLTAQAIQDVVRQGSDPARHNDPTFRHQLAYTVQDVENALRAPLAMSAELRVEMVDRAGSAPGLQNERMQELMRSTANIGDRNLVRDIRLAGAEIGSNADQSRPPTISNIESLENRARLAARAPEGPTSSEAPARHERASAAAAAPDADRARSANGTNQQQPPQQPQPASVTIHRTAVDVLLDGMRGAVEGLRGTGSPPWEPPHTPMKARFANFEERLRADKDTKAVTRAEQNGQAALDALQGFQNNEGAGIMSRIREAARNNPGGMEGVLSEMRPGGRFADLRTQFNSALEHDRGFAAAYDKASTALAQYGDSRTAVDAIIAKSPAAGLGTKFEALDAQIGEAAGKTPSSRDGMSKLDDITKQLAEIFQRAVEGVKSVFSRAAGTEASAQPSPSPSMGA
jgi:hypothetical protein